MDNKYLILYPTMTQHERLHKVSAGMKVEQTKRIGELQKHNETLFSSRSVRSSN